MTDTNWTLLRSLVRIPGPFRYLDPLEPNMLTANQSTGSDELRTIEGAMARFQGTLSSSTTQFRSWTRSLAWNSVTALSISGRGIYCYTSDATLDATWTAVRPGVQYTASGYLRATSAVSFQALIDWHTTAAPGGYITTSVGTGTALSTSNFNTRVAVTGTAPATAAYGVVAFVNTTTPGTILTVYADEIQLEEAAAASTFRLGAGTPWVSVESLGHSIILADPASSYVLHEVELILMEVG